MTLHSILLDIEGTTTDIRFVHDVLFPYSAERLPDFIRNHRNTPEVRQALDQVRETVLREDGQTITDEESIATLLQWIQTDRKHTALKSLQGLVWRTGYQQGDYQGHVYEDVLPTLTRWAEMGLLIGIYSSGSVEAQQLLFRHSTAGDLTPFFSHYFDTRVGGKKETVSYTAIATAIGLSPSDILFCSDMPDELAAARTAGYSVIQIVRPGTTPSPDFPQAPQLSEIAVGEAVG